MRKVLLLLAAAVLIAGCDNPQKTADKLRQEIIEFKAAPTDKLQAQIELDLAKFDEEVTALERKNSDKAPGLREQLISLRADYQAAKLARTVEDTKRAIQGVGQAIKDSAQSIGNIFKSSGTDNND